ncbi:MAG: hypothetical protein MZV70_45835 [Desulfobacterales bacterium]|nr:hypothetical protein [Desulfobacterales bacterium]
MQTLFKQRGAGDDAWVMLQKRAMKIPPFIVMDVLERAQALERQGRRIIHLEVGEPDFPTPECICEEANKAICGGLTHYTHSLVCSNCRRRFASIMPGSTR